MAENDNDEYHFVDIESTAPASVSEPEPTVDANTAFASAFTGKTNVKRNALFVILLVVMMMVIYSVINKSSSNKNKEVSLVPAAVHVAKQRVASVVTQPVAAVSPSVRNEAVVVADVNQKLTTLTLSQQNMRAELSSVNNQLNAFNGNINEITTKMAELNQVLIRLTSNMDAQSREMARLLAQKATVKTPTGHKMASHQVKGAALTYYIQAVIPGRAWLIATNGTTLTVREGTLINGYGAVKLIDSEQGRIITGSGQVIRFSQEDS